MDSVSFGRGGSWGEARNFFTGMVTGDYTWQVKRGTEATRNPLGCTDFHCSWFDADTRTAHVFDNDFDRTVGGRFVRGAPYNRCGFGRGHYDLAGLITHEIFGHGYWSGSKYTSHSLSKLWTAENVYNRAHDRPLACPP